MREILFKGKRIDNGEWAEGSFIDSGNHEQVFIYPHYNGASTMPCRNLVYHRMIAVDAQTLCQYTGLTDKNGNKIWENDILHLFGKDTLGNYDWKAVVEFGNPNSLYSWGYQLKPIGCFAYNTDILCWVGMEEANIYCEVIGNIFDNPEFLKGE